MKTIKSNWAIPEERKAKIIREIVDYFNAERDEEIGVLAAEEILDFFLEAVGKDIYNKSVEDAKGTVKKGLENLEVDLDVLFNK
ncbi:MAG: DUF2164 domain-containing protein [Candidatus Altimarinota bacterium]